MDWAADPSATGGARGPASNPALDAVADAIAALQDCDPTGRDAASLADDVVRIEQLLARLAAHEVGCVRAMHRRGDADMLGFRSTQAWLRHAARMAPSAAKSLVALADRVEDCPATGEALAAGRIGVRHAQLLARTMDEISPHVTGEAASAVEKELVTLAERVDPLRLADACRRLRLAAAPEHAVGQAWVAFEQRRLSISRTFAGLTAVDGVLDPVSAETVMAAVHAFAAPTGGDDERTPAQRRADALTEICRRVLTLGNPPTVGGERPHVLVTIPLAALTAGGVPGEQPAGTSDTGGGGQPDGSSGGDASANGNPSQSPGDASATGTSNKNGRGGDASATGTGNANGPPGSARGGGPADDRATSVRNAQLSGAMGEVGELAWAGPVPAELVRRIACDAAVTRIVVDPDSQPLDVGRTTRVVPAGIRKALLLRDKTCRYPGCDIPGVWCDAHHRQHWAHGGPTALHNLILLCAYHHARLHLTGEWITLAPDGTMKIITDPHPNHHDRDGPAP